MAESLSRRDLLKGGFLKDLMGTSERPGLGPSQRAKPATEALIEQPPPSQPPLAEVQVYGSERSVAPLSVEHASGESPPPWSRK
jgi:hypothetical protein